MAVIQSYVVSKSRKKVRSPINRFGGKHFLRHWLASMIPDHVLYCEVFAGGCHVLFSKPRSKIEIINDIDGGLVNFYRVLRDPDKAEKLQSLLSLTPYSRQEFYDCRATWQDQQDDVQKAHQWFVVNRMCFAGDMCRGGFSLPSTTGRNPAQSFRSAVDRIEDTARRLRNVTIECLDYADCIQRYDSPDTLFYIDCPYFGSEHYYGNSFSRDDHQNLAKLLHGVKGMVMISHYANGLYDTLYDGWHRFEYRSFKSSYKAEAGNKKPRTTEILYTNYEPVQTQAKIFENQYKAP